MIRIMVMNGLLISLILIWTSAAKEPSAGYLIKSSTKHPTGPLNYSVSKPMVSLHETNKEILRRKFLCGSELGGVCVNKKKSCPSNLPSEKSPGKPYCSKKKDRCCYPDPTTAAPPTVVPTTTTTSEDVNWSDIRNACIKSNNYKTYQPLALDICKEKCVEEDAINCQSIEYSSTQQMCAISEARSDSDDFIEPCFVDGWVFAERELNAGPTTGAPTTLAPSNTTINGPTTGAPTTTAPGNATTNVTSCNLVWNYEEDRPLIMLWGTQTVVPPITDIDISEEPNRLPEGIFLIFACPGENNQFKHVEGTHTKLHGECISHDQFKVCLNNQPVIMDLGNLSCSSKMHPSIIKQDTDTSSKRSCEDIGGELFKMGYIYGDYKEFKDLDTKVCFSEKDLTTLWTSTNIDRIEISPSMRLKDPTNFKTARGFAMNTFYAKKSQQETLKEVLDNEATSVWNEKACSVHGGHCVRGGKPCPEHSPHQTSQGEPFCNRFYRCCYSEQCDPTTCTYKGQKGNCSLDSLPGTTGVGSQECKKGCQCYIKDNKTLRQFKSLPERKEFSKLLRGECGEEAKCDPECVIGNCIAPNECECYNGWEGDICDIPKCGPECVNGNCIATNVCDCNDGWEGDICDIPVAAPCVMNLETDRPMHPPFILTKTNEAVLTKSVKVSDGDSLTFVCSGTEFESPNVGLIKLACTSGKLLYDGIEKKWKDMSCKSRILSKIRKKNSPQKKCNKDGGLLWEIGLETKQQPYDLYPLIDVCFNKNKQTTLWTKHTINGQIPSPWFPLGEFRPDWRPDILFPGVNMKTIYNEETQNSYFVEITDDEVNIGDRRFFNRGHLTPKMDFVTKGESHATFLYGNALPQWITYNDGNFETFETALKNEAKENNKDFEIITGGFGIMKVKDKKNSGKTVDVYLAQAQSMGNKVPIPDMFWKVVIEKSTNKGVVAFVINNNPLYKNAPASKCTNICASISWILPIIGTFGDRDKGFAYCCTVSDFQAKFPGISWS